MTRDDNKRIVPQCAERYTARGVRVRCARRVGHDGSHEDSRGFWPAEPAEKVIKK
jgi:hypothetical protein